MTPFPPPPHRIERTGDDSPAASLLGYVLRMSGHHQLWICSLAAVVAAISMVPLELQRRFVNDAIAAADAATLVWLGGAYLAVVLVAGLLKLALRLYQGWLTESAVIYTRRHLLELHRARSGDGAPPGEAEANGAGRAVSVIGPEVDQLGGFVGEGLSQPVVNGGMLLAIIGYMLWVEPLVAVVSLAFFVPQVVIVPVVQRHISRRLAERLEMLRELSDEVAGQADGADVPEPLAVLTDDIYRNRLWTYLLKFVSKAVINLLNHLAPLSVLVFGGWLAINGESSLGVVVAFVSGFERLSAPLRELLAFYRLAAQVRVQHDKIAQWM